MVKLFAEAAVIESGHGMDAWFMGDIRNGRQDSFTSCLTRLTRKGTEVCQIHFLNLFCHIQFNIPTA